MADFCVTAVRYNKERKHIDFLHVREETKRDGKPFLGQIRIVPRAFVADIIRRGNATFQTRIEKSPGTWSVGAHIHVIDEEYLTTDRNSTQRDNLENLPEF